MTSSISGNYGARHMHRPDSSQMASKLFSKLDTKNQGYLEQSDLQSAFNQIAGSTSSTSSSSSSSSSTNATELFSTLDSNSDGKLTQDEFSSGMDKLAQTLDQQFNTMRMHGGMGGPQGGGGGMPPPPPENDSGFTKDELSSQLEEIGSSDSQRSSLISNIVNNFDQADADGDGKVSFKEAMAYDQQSNSSGSSSGSSATSSTTASTDSSSLDAKLMKQIMQLMQTYGKPDDSTNPLSSLLSISA